ncbi:MAG: AAA family ATPase [Bacteroidales bacterium]|jgi:energy-coupling factor transporter ATP-binding protein EcfA2|nr:AAA family ATPase [Bacteroidales bacterium]
MNDEILEWIKSQHLWLQMAASKILANELLSDTDISELIQIIKETDENNPRKIRVGFPAVKKVDNKDSIKLLSIGPIEGIDKLSPRKPLIFGQDNLSVIYGQNGSGKSGFVRILKNICGKSNAIPLKSNVYASTPAEQFCTLRYTINGTDKGDIKWIANTPPIAELTNVDFFDATNGNFYLENETDTTYVPAELTLFSKLVNVSDKINKALDDECQRLVSALPKIPDSYLLTSYAKVYTALRSDTPQSKTDEISTFTSDDKNTLESLQQRLTTVDPAEAARKKRAVKKQIEDIMANIYEYIESISIQSITEIRTKSENAIQKRNAVFEGAQVLSETGKLDGIGSNTWRQLWSAARAYSTTSAYVDKPFPNLEEKARCVLCHQELDEEAKNRLKSFDAFVQGELETEAQKSEKEFEEAFANLPDIIAESSIKTICQAAELNETFSTEICTLFLNVTKVLELIRAKNIPDDKDIIIPPTKILLDELLRLSHEAEISAQQYGQDANDFDRNKAHDELLELEAKQWISQQKKAVEAEIERLKKIEKYQKWKKLTDTTKITKEASAVSEKLITEAYVSRFNNELKELGADKIEVELKRTSAAKGKVKHRIILKNAIVKTELNDVLSDGEKRIISLAAFLADVTGHIASVPFIFDDPISSLDQDYEEKTIERLVVLSKERQVIVFTHRLSFLSIISDKADDSLQVIHISRTPWGTTGEPDEFPVDRKKPDKAINDLKSRLGKVKKAFEEKDKEQYEYIIKATCSDFRKTIERFVEIVLLADVVQRHRRAINTVGKIQKLAKIQKNDCDLIDEMMSKYSRFEHSQSDESPIVFPTHDEIEKDINRMADWYEEFSKRPILSTGGKINVKKLTKAENRSANMINEPTLFDFESESMTKFDKQQGSSNG